MFCQCAPFVDVDQLPHAEGRWHKNTALHELEEGFSEVRVLFVDEFEQQQQVLVERLFLSAQLLREPPLTFSKMSVATCPMLEEISFRIF